MNKKVQIKEGVFYLDGKPVFLVSGDYPYYRDDPANWDDRLKKIKAAGIDAVTFYTPWRHHVIKHGGSCVTDFDGTTQPNRNLKLFMRLCANNRLWMVVKPGPFIHAETNFGGLPDWVSPDEDSEIEPFLDNNGKPHRWQKTLPAPLSKKFKEQVGQWFGLVEKNILKGNIYPSGNVIAIQICNEGLYSNAPAPVACYDYSDSSLERYRKYAGRGSMVARNYYGAKTRSGLNKYLDWGRWQSEYLRQVYKEYSSLLKSKVPLFININPPSQEKGLDHWLTRIIPENWPGINYGFTNWLNPVSEDPSSFDRYSFLANRRRGVNLEENWGFSKLYDARFQYPVICVFETMLAIANGATGFNVYTAVNTTCWDSSIDDKHERPYPDVSPIKEDGSVNRKYEVLSLLAGFFKENGPDFLGCRPDKTIAWGFYPPYACLAAWDIPTDDWKKIGLAEVRCGFKGLDRFHRVMRGRNVDFRIVNIEFSPLKELKAYKNIVLYGSSFMDRNTQRKLAGYISCGGNLSFVGVVPSLDENFKRCDVLRKKACCVSEMGNIFDQLAGVGKKLHADYPAVQVWVCENKKKDLQFFFILNLSEHSGIKEFTYAGRKISIAMAAKSSAVFRTKGSKLEAAFVKGVNEMNGTSVTPYISVGKDKFEVETACDLLALKKGNKWRTRIVK